MARNKTLEVGALNIVTHPHSPEKYVQLLKDAKATKKSVHVREHYYCRIGELVPIDKRDHTKGMRGHLYKHIQLDENEEWFNSRNNDVATEEDLKKVSIPNHLLPGLTAYDFIFYPKSHKLFYEALNEKRKALGARIALKAFSQLFNQPELKDEYGDVQVYTETSKEALNLIFRIKSLNRVTYEITMPNPDDHKKTEQKIKERFKKANIITEHTTLKSIPGTSLNLDAETKQVLNVASNNGYVIGVGKDLLGKKEEHSTKDHPMKEKQEYDPQNQIHADVFSDKASDMNNAILQNKNEN